MDLRAPKGTVDMLPETARAWERLVARAQSLFERYGYEPIYTPLFEHTELFARGIGEATDIVGKEMYTFADRSGRSLTLRPEGTAGVVRAAIEHTLVPQGSVAKLYYSGPMFRYERPQKGRMRQFWQIGVEILGAAEPSADAEVIALLVRCFEEFGIPRERMRLLLNSMGDESCRPAYRESVAVYIREHADALCDECRRRADTNPLRAFDCKNEGCQRVMADAPRISEALCDPCREHYASVRRHLDGLGIAYEEEPRLVRGLDYYTRTVFEVQAHGLGAQNAIGGGGRYDGLFSTLGGAPTPGLGFALGFERTLLALHAAGVQLGESSGCVAYVAAVDASCRGAAFSLAMALRDAGVPTELDHRGRSLKAQFKHADKVGARIVAVLGPEELAAGQATMRDMVTRQETTVALADVPSFVRAQIG